MPRLHVVNIVGARPQFVKVAAISEALRHHPEVRETIIDTGQHYTSELSSIFLRELRIPRPQLNLRVGSGTHAQQTGRVAERVEEALQTLKPDWVLVYGDTNTTLGAVLAAAKLNIKIGHVEAGLRCGDRSVPEEVNRIVADHLSTLNFTPTTTATDNLKKEGISTARILRTGDVMFDLFRRISSSRIPRSSTIREIQRDFPEFALLTIHRAENTEDENRLRVLNRVIHEITREIPVLFPAHPRTVKAAQKLKLRWPSQKSFKLIAPVGYLEMLSLESAAQLILTDSGGVQKEAFFSSVPCVTLRSHTEWRELLETGWSTLVEPRNSDQVISAIHKVLSKKTRKKVRPERLYGDGHAAERIAEALSRYDSKRPSKSN